MTQPATVRQDSSPTGSVLVADDDPALLVLVQAALVPDGHTVVAARDGEEACRLFTEQVPDVVLLDVTMPVLDGYAACARLRRSAGGERTPILMLTANADAESVARAYEVGATDFQAKPVDWRVLRERVKYMLKAKRDADELAELAHYDNLTGLPNRATFRGHLKRGLRLAEEQRQLLAVLFLDLDGFKEINDTFGHGFGDQVLKLAASAPETHSGIRDKRTRRWSPAVSEAMSSRCTSRVSRTSKGPRRWRSESAPFWPVRFMWRVAKCSSRRARV